jgi:hypothetical protein
MDNVKSPTQHSFYVVVNDDGKYFAGFNPTMKTAQHVTSPLAAKLFTNKYEVKLRPNERLVEIKVDFSAIDAEISAPFRPRRRTATVVKNTATAAE